MASAPRWVASLARTPALQVQEREGEEIGRCQSSPILQTQQVLASDPLEARVQAEVSGGCAGVIRTSMYRQLPPRSRGATTSLPKY